MSLGVVDGLGVNGVPYNENDHPGEQTVLEDKMFMQRFETTSSPSQEYCGTYMINRC